MLRNEEEEMDLTTLKATPPWEWPSETPQTLLKSLRQERADETDRLLAAELAGDYVVINDELVEALLSVLADPGLSEKLRARAAVSLGPVLEGADSFGFEDPGEVPIAEPTFRRIQVSLETLYADDGVSKAVRRPILEASVRAPQDWHRGAIRAAYGSPDRDWQLTAVFAMRWIRGFADQILEALDSRDEEIRYGAVRAAGNWAIDLAWSPVRAIVTSANPDKSLLLAAIDAVASIRPQEARMILADLTDSGDEDIVEASYEAIAMAEGDTWEDSDERADEEFSS